MQKFVKKGGGGVNLGYGKKRHLLGGGVENGPPLNTALTG